jgi:hypothetical protein
MAGVVTYRFSFKEWIGTPQLALYVGDFFGDERRWVFPVRSYAFDEVL